MRTLGDVLLAFVALYPVCIATFWMAGGLLFRLREEPIRVEEPDEGWPGVSVLIPAYNEEDVIATSVRAALAVDYPNIEVLILDDGSADETTEAAELALGGDPRSRVIRDSVNRGKAERLNRGFRVARYDLVVVIDADTHIHPAALKLAVTRMRRSPMVAAVAGAPHVTNRGTLLLAMQVLEAAAIIGLMRRTHSLTGRVGVVAGVLGLFRRDRVLAVGGFDPHMATEDVDLSWKLLLAGWETVYEPRALVGMQVPSKLSALWAQRTRWARGQGEVLHAHLRETSRWQNHRMWLIALESLASLIWIVALVGSLIIAAFGVALGGEDPFGFAFAWGVGIAMIATLQLAIGLTLDRRYDPTILRTFLIAAPYPLVYWIVSAAAALRAQVVALIRGPSRERVVWDIPRERLGAGPEGAKQWPLEPR